MNSKTNQGEIVKVTLEYESGEVAEYNHPESVLLSVHEETTDNGMSVSEHIFGSSFNLTAMAATLLTRRFYIKELAESILENFKGGKDNE